MSELSYNIIYAFATSPETGNPAAVVLLPPAPEHADLTALASLYPPDKVLQATAAKANQPMTAFALPLPSKSSTSRLSYPLRWFNPVTEAWLCGHATMATSALVFEQQPQVEAIEYTTMKYGVIRALKGSQDREVMMDFPEITDIKPVPLGEWTKVLDVIDEAGTGLDRSAVLEVWDSEDRMLVEMNGEFDLANLQVDCKKMASLAPKTFILTQVVQDSGAEEQIRSRVSVIVPGYEHEDSVTGSAHCLVIPYFRTNPAAQARLQASSPIRKDTEGNNLIHVHQVSPRGGKLQVSWRRAEGTVRIAGRSVF
ncbi:uncharacterized protein MKK02DRAFT_44472 [Dioszegia hungarica]|uniref:Phenazine biosynthesis PhzC/PhzF protein n=1 Tax=Dioszegia hungarica TaxID=4972 RepID=A0AA38H7G9_9TREE|nr:uncharacterized protein MKK02DRAFT_44472 [Dioszegia hungarica]KAI9635770.1 hypothetical protein MKK02DRAFT_44472 [Dioszegia hungarica]